MVAAQIDEDVDEGTSVRCLWDAVRCGLAGGGLPCTGAGTGSISRNLGAPTMSLYTAILSVLFVSFNKPFHVSRATNQDQIVLQPDPLIWVGKFFTSAETSPPDRHYRQVVECPELNLS